MTKKQEYEAKMNELENQLKRLAADFDNYRKRTEQLKIEWLKSASKEVIFKIVPVLDNFRRAIEHAPKEEHTQNWFQGIEQIAKQLEGILAAEGVTKIEVRPGEHFDPEKHEAISHEENKEIKKDSIIAIVEDGWQMSGRVLKPVKVRVSKGK